METVTNKNEFIGIVDAYECEISFEEQEQIMSSKWFNDWMIEYHSY